MKKLVWLFWILIFAVILFFVMSVQLKNDNLVEINYYFNIQHQISVFWLLSIPFLSGLLLGVIIMSFSVFKHKRRGSAEKKKLVKVEKEVENLRALPLKDEV